MRTILFIDDELTVLELYSALLESKGYKVLTAPDGPSGIALSRKHFIDGVVLDFHLSNMHADQVAQELRNEDPGVPVVIWNGCPNNGTLQSPKRFADALLCGFDTLLSTVDKVLKDSDMGNVPSERMVDKNPIPTFGGSE